MLETKLYLIIEDALVVWYTPEPPNDPKWFRGPRRPAQPQEMMYFAGKQLKSATKKDNALFVGKKQR